MSQYFCHNLKCAIAISKTPISVAMNCPVCQTPLVEYTETLSEADEKLLASLPYVIAYPLKRTLLEKHVWTKINFLKDTFLNYLKYIGLITATEFFNSPLKDRKMVALFQQALAEPSFGSWNQYIRETMSYLKENNHSFFCEDLVSYYDVVESGKKRKLYKGEIQTIDSNGDILIKKQEATAIGMLINFRNRYLGHGLTLDESESQKLWDNYFPIFRNLLEQMDFSERYPMYKHEHGESYLLKSAELMSTEKGQQRAARVWIENLEGCSMDILPFYIVPGEVSLTKEDKEQILAFESYTGKTIKFFSPEGTEKQSSGRILERLNLLLYDKQKEQPYAPEDFSREVFLSRIADENKLTQDQLLAEQKVIPGVYVPREEMETKLREWIGARANVFFIAAEAGSGKTNLLVEMQRQYSERQLPSLLIRAARMEKETLEQQLAYLLNLDIERGIVKYTSTIGGTQAAPMFIFIDGLNEASNAEKLWREVIEITRLFKPASLKFVVTCRVNTKSDLDRFCLNEDEWDQVFGENNEIEKSISSYIHWLTPLKMTEIKKAWEAYGRIRKDKYKPYFTFDNLAMFDRTIYSQISNPLVLRLFLETYHGKKLPNKKDAHLNIWKDWVATFSAEEQTFFRIIAGAIWEKGENELLLDDLLKDETLKSYFTTDLINAPYSRLKLKGWLSRYIKDLNVFVSFTVEGALFYLFGERLQSNFSPLSTSYIVNIIDEGYALKLAGIEEYLSLEAKQGKFNLISDLIDLSEKSAALCVKPMLHHLKIKGVEVTLNMLLENTSNNDWSVILELINDLEDQQLFDLKKQISNWIFNWFKGREKMYFNLEVALEIYEDLEFVEKEILLNSIEEKIQNSSDNVNEFLSERKKLAYFYFRNGFPEKAIFFYENIYDLKTLNNPLILNVIGASFDNLEDEKNAIEFYSRAMKILIDGDRHGNLLGNLYFNLSIHEKNIDKKIELLDKSLSIKIDLFGEKHKEVADTIAALGLAKIKGALYDEGFVYLNKALEILTEINGDLTEIKSFLSFYFDEIEDFKKALEYRLEALEITISKVGHNSPILYKHLSQIGELYYKLGDDEKSLDFYKQAENVLGSNSQQVDSLIYIKCSIGYVSFWLSKYDESIKYYNQAMLIHNESPTSYSNSILKDIFYYSGYAYYCKFEYEKSIKLLINLVDLKKEDIGVENFVDYNKIIGHCLFYLERYEDSVRHYQLIINEIEDFNVKNEIFYYSGYAYYCKFEYEKSIKLLINLVDLKKEDIGVENFVDYNKIIGHCLFYLERYEDSVRHYQLIINEIEDFNVKNEIFELIATCYELIGQYDEAGEQYKKCLSFSKEPMELSRLNLKLGKCYQVLKKYELAIEAFEKGIEHDKNIEIYFKISECYESNNDKKMALQFFIEAGMYGIQTLDVNNEMLQNSIVNAKRLARELGKLSDLPEWMRS